MENFIDGAWYRWDIPSRRNCILRYNAANPKLCIGYWHLENDLEDIHFDYVWAFQVDNNWVPATEEDLDKLGSEWREE